MGNRIIGMVTLVCFIAYLGGCSSARFISLEQYQKRPPESRPNIVGVMTMDGTFCEFDLRAGTVRIEEDGLTGTLMDGRLITLAVNDIKTVQIMQSDTDKILLAAGLILAVVLISISLGGGFFYFY